MLKDKDITIHTADDVVSVIQREMKEKTKNFQFCVVESFPEFERCTEWDELKIHGISKLHCFFLRDGNLYFAEESCTDCSVSKMCASCSTTPDATTEHIKRAIDWDDDEEEEDRIMKVKRGDKRISEEGEWERGCS